MSVEYRYLGCHLPDKGVELVLEVLANGRHPLLVQQALRGEQQGAFI